jgi:nitroreductase
VEFREIVRTRAMVRSFSDEPVDPAIVDRLLSDALRAPTAGNTGGTAWVVLEGPAQTGVYFDATTDLTWRASSTRWEGLRRAPVVLLAYSSPDLYLARYREPDKARSGLGDGKDCWPVEYWTADAAFAVMTVLLGAVDCGLGASVLGAFRGAQKLATQLGVPDRWQLFCAVALGYPDGNDHRSRSLDRTAPGPGTRIHRGRW